MHIIGLYCSKSRLRKQESNYLSSLKTLLSTNPRNTLECRKVKSKYLLNKWDIFSQTLVNEVCQREMNYSLNWCDSQKNFNILTEVDPCLLHNRILILSRNLPHLYFQMGSWHSSGNSYLSRGRHTHKSQTGRSYFTYPKDNYSPPVSPCFSGWI